MLLRTGLLKVQDATGQYQYATAPEGNPCEWTPQATTVRFDANNASSTVLVCLLVNLLPQLIIQSLQVPFCPPYPSYFLQLEAPVNQTTDDLTHAQDHLMHAPHHSLHPPNSPQHAAREVPNFQTVLEPNPRGKPRRQ